MGGIIVYREDRDVVRAFGGIQAMKCYPVHEWQMQKRGDWSGRVPASWRVPQADLRQHGLVPIDKAEALRLREMEQRSGTLRTQAYRRKVDMLAHKLGLLPGSGIAQSLVDGTIGEEEAFQKALTIQARHERTRYDELLARGYSWQKAREMIEGGK
jgi:hypothetical protein